MKFNIEPADDGQHKWVGIFTDEEGKETKIKFGAKGYEDFTQHKNRLRRTQYLSRHKSREDWLNPMTAGALSKWILWGDSPSMDTNVRYFKQKFNLE